MADQNEVALQKFFKGLEREIKKRVPVATGETRNAIYSDVSRRIGLLIGPLHLGALEFGRGPTRNPNPGPEGQRLKDKILRWIKARGISSQDISDESLAFIIARKIHNEGTKLYRSGGQSGVLSDVITEEAVNQLSKELRDINIQLYESRLLKIYKSAYEQTN